MCLRVCERYSPGGTELWKGGIGVLSIGTVPPRARWTEGMRYIVKPKNKISAEKRKKPSRPCSGASSHPLRLQNVRNLSRTEIETEEKICCSTQTRVQTPGQHFLRLPKYHKPFPSQSEKCLSQQNQVTNKANIRNVKSNLESSYNIKYNSFFYTVPTKSYWFDCCKGYKI